MWLRGTPARRLTGLQLLALILLVGGYVAASGRGRGILLALQDAFDHVGADDESPGVLHGLQVAFDHVAVVAGVAHEVRNPLFGISSTLDAMEARYGSTESGRYLEVLREQVDRLSRLMQELLEYGRPYTLELSPGLVEEAIGEALRVAKNVQPASDVRAVYDDGGAGPSLVRMDRARLVGALTNLVENAIQHSPPGETVTVTASPLTDEAGSWIEVAVIDRGPGIPTEDVPKIFEPFFTRRRGGTGLGLSIVQRIVEEHGGVVWAQNGPSGGAVLTVRLPVGGSQTPAEADLK